jgi:mannose-6-phosphate isomerase
MLGERALTRFGPSLPFLFKVLSIARPLSIQLHPDIESARRLHAEDPASFPDENHKPEIAIALTPLALLHGVKSPQALRQALADYPEIAALCPTSPNSWNDAELAQNLFQAVYRAEPATLAAVTAALQTRLGASADANVAPICFFLESFAAYGPQDPGLLCFFLLNYLELPPGAALFTPARVPHAYLKGDIVECMANSNNVVRAGLTPKQQHPELLLELMSFEAAQSQPLQPTKLTDDGSRKRFCPPIEEFWVEQIEPSAEVAPLKLDAAAVVICVEGCLQLESDTGNVELKMGEVAFIAAATPNLRAKQVSGKSFLACVAT